MILLYHIKIKNKSSFTFFSHLVLFTMLLSTKMIGVYTAMKSKHIITAFFCFVALSLTGCSNNKEPVSIEGFKLDTYITITVYDNVSKDVLNGCLDICDKYELMFSRTLPESTLYKVNHHELSTIPAELAQVIQTGLDYGTTSCGSFDITIGSVSSLWDFTSDNPHIPADSLIKNALSYVNYQNVTISPSENDSNMYNIDLPQGTVIDVGAIAKGYIADRIKDYLIENKVEHAIINLGGNVLLVGGKTDSTDFNIGIQKPFSGSDELLTTLNLNDKSAVSSGTYERSFEYKGKVYHHILNPSTGYPYDNGLSQVTIISDDSFTGDILSTTCFSMGLDKGMKLVESLENVEAIFVTSDNSIHYSSGISKYYK